MKLLKILSALLTSATLLLGSAPALAADLEEIKARGELRHLGIRYANFVTGSGDGFDVELVQGFARHIGVKYTLGSVDIHASQMTLATRATKEANRAASLS